MARHGSPPGSVAESRRVVVSTKSFRIYPPYEQSETPLVDHITGPTAHLCLWPLKPSCHASTQQHRQNAYPKHCEASTTLILRIRQAIPILCLRAAFVCWKRHWSFVDTIESQSSYDSTTAVPVVVLSRKSFLPISAATETLNRLLQQDGVLSKDFLTSTVVLRGEPSGNNAQQSHYIRLLAYQDCAFIERQRNPTHGTIFSIGQ